MKGHKMKSNFNAAFASLVSQLAGNALDAMEPACNDARQWQALKGSVGNKLTHGRYQDLTQAEMDWITTNDPQTLRIIQYARRAEAGPDPYDPDRCTNSQADELSTGAGDPLGHGYWYAEAVRHGEAIDYRKG